MEKRLDQMCRFNTENWNYWCWKKYELKSIRINIKIS